MLKFIAFGCLLLAGHVQLESSAICGTQPCDYPNQCQNKPDSVSVCVRNPAPTCVGVSCPSGQQCILQQNFCGNNLPCNPQPTCVTASPCGYCDPTNGFCELYPSGQYQPVCRLVVEPTCRNKSCPQGQHCNSTVVTLNCFVPPCGLYLECVDDY